MEPNKKIEHGIKITLCDAGGPTIVAYKDGVPVYAHVYGEWDTYEAAIAAIAEDPYDDPSGWDNNHLFDEDGEIAEDFLDDEPRGIVEIADDMTGEIVITRYCDDLAPLAELEETRCAGYYVVTQRDGSEYYGERKESLEDAISDAKWAWEKSSHAEKKDTAIQVRHVMGVAREEWVWVMDAELARRVEALEDLAQAVDEVVADCASGYADAMGECLSGGALPGHARDAGVPAPICGDLEKAEGVDLLAELAARLKHYAGFVEKAIEGLPLDRNGFVGYDEAAVFLQAPGVGWFKGMDVTRARERVCELVIMHDLTRAQAMYVAAEEEGVDKTLHGIFNVNSGVPITALQAARRKMSE